MWDVQTRQFILPKLGHDVFECEDVVAVNAETLRFAVADGATEAFDARKWAERLARQWVAAESVFTVDEFRQWVAAEGRELHHSWNDLSLSWYAEEKAQFGSFAAFVGVELDLASDSPSWKAIALGDACLLHCRGEKLLRSFPLSRAENFHMGPMLVASDSSLHENSMKSVAVASGSCNNGDVLLLLSDAVALWFLERFEENQFNPNEFLNPKQDEELEQFFDGERLAGRLRNDDLAILQIEIKQRRFS